MVQVWDMREVVEFVPAMFLVSLHPLPLFPHKGYLDLLLCIPKNLPHESSWLFLSPATLATSSVSCISWPL